MKASLEATMALIEHVEDAVLEELFLKMHIRLKSMRMEIKLT